MYEVVVIQLATLAFLNKALNDGTDGSKKNNYPKDGVPDLGLNID